MALDVAYFIKWGQLHLKFLKIVLKKQGRAHEFAPCNKNHIKSRCLSLFAIRLILIITQGLTYIVRLFWDFSCNGIEFGINVLYKICIFNFCTSAYFNAAGAGWIIWIRRMRFIYGQGNMINGIDFR